MANNQTRRNKNKKNKFNGGSNCGNMMPKVQGGRRKTRKMSKGASDWNKKVMEVYRQMKKKNPLTKLGDAMKHAAALKKKGQLY
jgi:hypothetical protein